MSKPAILIDYLCDGRLRTEPQTRPDAQADTQRHRQPYAHLLAGELLAWMERSPRFTAFVESYRNKIRKKLRLIRQPEAALDLRSELEAAYRLLADRRLELAYEPYASEKRRGPDFGITYRVNLVFNLEVARIRAGQDGGIDLARLEERILRSLLDKLGQMQAGMPNLLAIQTQAAGHAIDLERLMQTVKTRVERNDPAFFAASRSPDRYTGPAEFYKDFLHLSGILLWSSGGESSSQMWLNQQARPGLEEKVVRIVSGLLG